MDSIQTVRRQHFSPAQSAGGRYAEMMMPPFLIALQQIRNGGVALPDGIQTDRIENDICFTQANPGDSAAGTNCVR